LQGAARRRRPPADHGRGGGGGAPRPRRRGAHRPPRRGHRPHRGATAPRGGVMVGVNRMDRILEIDLVNRYAVVEPGVVNLSLTRVAEAVRTALATFDSIEAASAAVSAIIAAGIIPAALEALDEPIIKAVEAGVHAGYPTDAKAVLLIELDGPAAEVGVAAQAVDGLCRAAGALTMRVAKDDTERALLWKGRKEAAGAVGRLTHNYVLQHAVVPRSKLPQIM